jgi:DNA-binding MarR family transcriptional regulator
MMSNPNTLPLSDVLEVRDTCLCFATQRAARVLARRFDTLFRPLGITNNQFSLMMPLNSPRRMTLTELSAFLGMDQTTMSAALKALVRAGLVRVEADEKDRRIRRAELTARGCATLHAALPFWREEHAAIERELVAPTPGELRAGLAALAELKPPAARSIAS